MRRENGRRKSSDNPRANKAPRLSEGKPSARKQSRSAQAAVTPSAGHKRGRHRFKYVQRDVLKGILFILIILSIKLLIEGTTFGKHLELMDYGFLQTQLSKERVPVAIIDISDLAQKDFVVNGEIVRATPREPLKEMIEALAEQKPKAIGIDIDFSPDENGYILPRDPDFFEFCLALTRRTGIPVFLGIKRTIGNPAAEWLGDERNEELAAGILVPRDTRRMVSLIEVEQESAPENRERRITTVSSMSRRLASVWGQQIDRPVQSQLLKWGVLEKLSEKHLDYGVSPADFLVDYGPLDSVEIVPAADDRALRDGAQRDKIFGQLILMGDATLGKATDVFPVPGRQQQLYPGVFLHACGAYTLIKAPLYELTRLGHVVIDVLLAGVILGALVLIGLFYHDPKTRERATDRLRGFLTFLAVAAAIVIGVVFVRVTRIMWDDFFLALLLLVFHPAIEARGERLWAQVEKVFSRGGHSRAREGHS
jgi:CHASE2 domain-containing sensor protein